MKLWLNTWVRFALVAPALLPLIALPMLWRAPAAASRAVHRTANAHDIRTAGAPDVDPSRKSQAENTATPPQTDRFDITFFHVHTLELMPLTLGAPIDSARVATFLRCRVTNVQHEMDPVLLPLAEQMATVFHSNRVDVVSGFRSEKMNELLRKKGHQVARDSQHTHGTALDFRIPNVPADRLAAEVARVHRGGIGIYRVNNFVHADTGRPRRWNGR